MSSRSWMLGVALLAGGIALWFVGSRYSSQVDQQVAVADHDHADHAGEAPDGDRVTLQFFKNPAAVPAITMVDLSGRHISIDDLRGKVTIVNFWATWCPPCRAEIPDLVALQQKYGDRLQIIGVSQDEGPVDAVKSFMSEHRINYPIVMMTEELGHAFPGVRALPTTFVLDRETRVVQRHVGLLNAALTENETRALAGLPVNASIVEVDRAQPAKLGDTAQATTIPGVDLAVLTPAQRTEALKQLNSEPCTCGCENTIAKCRIDDPTCTASLPVAKQIVERIAQR